ncbi:MAG: 50S ribosomal protein L29 [Acidobacteria bacterium]|nr:50S ribosomal protein L29 [Acidobacteriota bacterium]
MKVRERVKKIRDKSVDELVREEGEMREQMFKLRFQLAMGQSETLKKMRELRKDRARVLTIKTQKEREK